MAINDCVSWKPELNGSAHGSMNAVRRFSRYADVTAITAMPAAAIADERKEVTQLHAGEEQHAKTGGQQHRRRAEVRLHRSSSGSARHQHTERLEEALQLFLQLALPPHDVAAQI